MSQWTPPSAGNKFKSGDIVIIGNMANRQFEVDHVESTRVFLKNPTGRRLLDVSAAQLMLLSDWKRIYGK